MSCFNCGKFVNCACDGVGGFHSNVFTGMRTINYSKIMSVRERNRFISIHICSNSCRDEIVDRDKENRPEIPDKIRSTKVRKGIRRRPTIL